MDPKSHGWSHIAKVAKFIELFRVKALVHWCKTTLEFSSAFFYVQSTVQVILPITKCNFEICKLFCCLSFKLSLALVSRMKCIRGNVIFCV